MAIEPRRVHNLLNPTSIALLGATERGPWTAAFAENIRASNVAYYMVNPKRKEVFGHTCYPALRDLPGEVDHAVVLVQAERVYGAIEECAAAGVKSATVIASGFAESGPEGQRLGEAIKQLCLTEGVALVGPNCFGFNNYSGTYVSRYSISVPSVPGNIGFSFQSGQLGASAMEAAYARGIKLAYGISSGNELVVDWNDYQEFFLECPEIKVLGGVVERIPERERFAAIARRALELGKPIVLLKPGRSPQASRIAIAHTGSITGSDAIVDAFLRDLGIIRVDSIEELVETAGLLAKRGWPQGPRVTYVGFSGGASELFADQVHGSLLEFPTFGPQIHRELSAVTGLPLSAIQNPFDLTAEGLAKYDDVLRILSAMDDVDSVVSQGVPFRAKDDHDGDPHGEFRASRERALSREADANGKFAVMLDSSDTQPGDAVFVHEPSDEMFYALGHNGVRSIVNGTAYGVRRRKLLRKVIYPQLDIGEVEMLGTARGQLSEPDGKALLRAYGIPITKDITAHTQDEAVRAAEELGYPVVMKVVGESIAHKSELGGVRLGLSDRSEVRAAFNDISDNVTRHAPGIHIDGVMVSHEVVGAAEFLAGITSDSNVGHAVVVGLGGIYVEILDDTALGIPPITTDKALDMLGSLRCSKLLEGSRGEPPRDVAAFADVLVRLGKLAEDLSDRLAELDINPLLVLAEGEGVVAADALVVLRSEGDSELEGGPGAVRSATAGDRYGPI